MDVKNQQVLNRDERVELAPGVEEGGGRREIGEAYYWTISQVSQRDLGGSIIASRLVVTLEVSTRTN